jgi:anti-sigma-K factor RskA
MTAMSNSQQLLTKSLLDSAAHYQSIRNQVYVLNDPMFKVVRLNGLKVSPAAKATACWCPDSKELYFSPESLPAAPAGMEYQLWAIVDGKPVDAGMIKIDSGMQKMKLIANATAFAVTLEKAGGSPTPKGDMYVMGNI